MTIIDRNVPYKRIATEEAWCPPSLFDALVQEARNPSVDDPGFQSVWGFFTGESERARSLARRIQASTQERIQDMDAAGIDIQVLSLTTPGVQLFDPQKGTALAREYNDQLADYISINPKRFVGLAAFSPLDPANAAKELERGVRNLGLRGGILNSHTRGVFLDDEKYWDVFEAAEALDVPIYLHPNALSPGIVEPFLKRGLEAAIYGYACETGLHALRLVIAGLFDRFPRLQIVLGHCGESLPFSLYRITYMHGLNVRGARYEHVKPLRKKASDYLKENFLYTSSGVADAAPIMFLRDVIGSDRVMYAMDYPYQFESEEVAILDNLPLDDVGKKQFFEGNARRVFRIDA